MNISWNGCCVLSSIFILCIFNHDFNHTWNACKLIQKTNFPFEWFHFNLYLFFLIDYMKNLTWMNEYSWHKSYCFQSIEQNTNFWWLHGFILLFPSKTQSSFYIKIGFFYPRCDFVIFDSNIMQKIDSFLWRTLGIDLNNFIKKIHMCPSRGKWST